MDDLELKEGRAPEGMAGLVKGLVIIEAFGRDCSRMTITDAARVAGCSRAAARRCLLSLFEQGYLTHDSRYYRPTPRMLRLGNAYLEAEPLPQIAMPFIEEARDRLHESVSIAVYEDNAAMVVARAEADQIVPTGVRVGTRMPLHCTAVGRVLLAGMHDDIFEAILREQTWAAHTGNTKTSFDRLRSSVLETRALGYAVNDEELDLGLRAMAVPVCESRHGQVVAAVSVSSFTARVPRERFVEECLPVLREAAAKIGKSL